MLIKSENCRICAEVISGEVSTVISLVELSPIDGQSYSDIYQNVSGCKPEVGPQNLCENCTETLLDAYKLTERIKEVEKNLLECFIAVETVSEDRDEVEGIKIEVKPSLVESDSDDYNIPEPDPEPEPESPKPIPVRKKKVCDGGDKATGMLGYQICPFCPYTVPDRRNIRKHCRLVHAKKMIRCLQCNSSFDYTYHLENHLMEGCNAVKKIEEIVEENPSALSISCAHCTKIYNDYFHLALHCKNEHPDVNLPCSDCPTPKQYYLSEQWIYHRRKIHQDKELRDTGAPQEKSETICCYCGKMMLTASLYYHMNTVHENKEHQVEYICDICGAKIHRKNGILQHMRHKHLGTVYNCRYCSETFPNVGNRRNHEIRFHTSDYKHQCNVCNKMFMTNSQLRKHRVIHTGEKNFRCEVCGMLFAWRGTWKNHLVTHSDARPFACTTCGATFKTKKALNVHENVHREYNYECPVCQQKFLENKTLRVHWSKSHPDYPLPPPGTVLNKSAIQRAMEINAKYNAGGLTHMNAPRRKKAGSSKAVSVKFEPTTDQPQPLSPTSGVSPTSSQSPTPKMHTTPVNSSTSTTFNSSALGFSP